MTLQPHLSLLALKRKRVARGKRAPRAPSIVGWFFPLPWQGYVAGSVAPSACHLALVAARAPLEVIGEDATSVIISSPPLEMGEQVWRLLCRRPGATSQCRSSMSDGQWSPFNKSRVEPSRKAQTLSNDFENVLCSKTHYLRDPYQLTPAGAFLHLAIDQTCLHLPLASFPSKASHLEPLPKMGRQSIKVHI
jgi:hypothetical protein